MLRSFALILLLLASNLVFSQKKKAEQLFANGLDKFNEKDYSGAIADYTEAITARPNYAEAYYNRAVAKRWLNDQKGGIADLEQAIKYKHNYQEAYFEKAYQEYDIKNYQATIADYTKSLELKPNDIDAYYNRGLAKYALKDYSGSISDNSKAIELDPSYLNAYLNRSLARYGLNDYQGILADNLKLIELDPGYIDAHYSIGFAKYYLKDYTGSIAAYTKTIELKQDYDKAYYSRGLSKHANKDYTGAISDFTKVLEINPQYYEAYYSRGLSKYDNKDYSGGLTDFTKSIESDPYNADAFYGRGLCNYYLKNYKASAADYQIALDINPDYEEVKKELFLVNTELKRSVPATEAENLNIDLNVKLPQIWAVVVGVSNYKNPKMNLKYADKDATDFYNFLKSPAGGSVDDEHIILLTNEKATRSNIIKALNDKFNRAFEDDMVILFIASHGQPDPVGNEIYFLNHEAESDNLGGTAVSQLDIEKVFQRTKAKKKIWIADACHSGGAGLQVRADHNALANKLLTEIANSNNGMAMFTASSSSEYSYEDQKWGGGHGVFTYYLMKGMKGEADSNKNGLIDLRELFEFVYRGVSTDTDGKQHPELKGSFDNKLPIAIHH